MVAALCVVALGLAAAGKKAEKAPPAPAAEEMAFESYQLVLLKRGAAWTPEKTPALEELQRQHLAHLGKMGESGKMVIAGPFGDQADESMRGMCLYRVGSVEEARTLAENDPMVKAGRLKVEVLTWYVEKGYMTFPKAFAAPPAK